MKKEKLTWNIEKVKIKDLCELAINARRLQKHDAEHIEKSLKNFGQCEPVVINTDGTIIGGHQRVKILKKMGKREVDVSRPSRPLTEKEVKELNIRLNRNSGEFDFDILANAWEPDELIEFGFTTKDLGFGDVDDILKEFEEIDKDESSEDSQKEEKSSPSASTMSIFFNSVEDLQSAENRISAIVDEFPKAHYKIKI